MTRYDKNFLLMLLKTYKYTEGIVSLSELMQLRQELLTIYMENNSTDKIISICSNFAGNDASYWIQALNYFINSCLDNRYEYIEIILKKITENELLSPIAVLEILAKEPETNFEIIRKFYLNVLTKEYKTINMNKNEAEANLEKENAFREEINEIKTKACQFSIGKCSICNQSTNNSLSVTPVVYFLCHHSFHLNCLNAQMIDDNKDEAQCPTCWQRSNHVLSRLKQSSERNENYNEFIMELGNTPKKFDHISKTMGMGVFKTN